MEDGSCLLCVFLRCRHLYLHVVVVVVCVCVCVCVCLCACTCVCTVQRAAFLDKETPTYHAPHSARFNRTTTCTTVLCVFVDTFVCVSGCKHLYLYGSGVCLCVCVYVCVHVCVHTRTRHASILGTNDGPTHPILGTNDGPTRPILGTNDGPTRPILGTNDGPTRPILGTNDRYTFTYNACIFCNLHCVVVVIVCNTTTIQCKLQFVHIGLCPH